MKTARPRKRKTLDPQPPAGPSPSAPASSSPEDDRSNADPASTGYRFSTGHRVVMVRQGEREEVQIRAKDGGLQLRIVLTEAGPVIQLQHAELEVHSLGTIRTRCQSFEVEAEHIQLDSRADTTLQSGADLHLRAEGECVARAGLIRLN
jgi:hypothetical protein